MIRFMAPVLCLALAACGAANHPQAAGNAQPQHNDDSAKSSTGKPPTNQGRSKFEVPDGLPLPPAEETPLYKLIAQEYFAALGQFDLAGLRRTLSQRVQNDAGARLSEDIAAMREQYSHVTFDEVSWQADGEKWVCTFNQTLHPKKGEPEVERDCKIFLVKDKGRWFVEQ